MTKTAPRFKRPSLIPYQIFWFDWKHLRGGGYRLIVALIVIVDLASLAFALTGNVIGILIACLAVLLTTIELGRQFRPPTQCSIYRSNESQRLTSQIEPSLQEEEAGYESIPVPERNDRILMSWSVNEHLFLHADRIQTKLDKEVEPRLLKSLIDYAELYRTLLLHQHYNSRKRRRQFFNERKISLLSTITNSSSEVILYPSSYFLSYLTNQSATLDMDSMARSSHPGSLWRGKAKFPIGTNTQRIKTLKDSQLSNHIGTNTLAICRDGQLILWRQGKKNQRSSMLLAPTGSGSMDYCDYESASSTFLKDIVVAGMNRELEEECHVEGGQIRDIIADTLIIGYYRWVGNAGLPGFLGVSRLLVPAEEIEPNNSEVHEPPEKATVAADNCEKLVSSIRLLLREANLSVPLYANLIALLALLESHPKLSSLIYRTAA